MFQSKMIIEAHRGKIEVESVAGKGSTFRVFLPLAARSAQDRCFLVAAEAPHTTRSVET